MTRDLPKALTPPSPSASFYDMSDDEEGEYNTILHSSSGRGVKLLFSKSKVSYVSDLDIQLFIIRRFMFILLLRPKIIYPAS